MKKIILLLITIALVLTSCGSLSIARGLENDAFLEFVGTVPEYRDGVDVNIDGISYFKARVYNVDNLEGDVYAISAGKHTVTVSYNGIVIYKKKIFVSSQETKRIILL
jgi:hypothetical protein